MNEMKKDHILIIWRCLYCADNNELDLNDKYYKLRLLGDLVQQNFLKMFAPDENLNYDECTVKYFRKHSCKQFVQGKPIIFRYKLWRLNTKSGWISCKFFVISRKRYMRKRRIPVFEKTTAPLLMLLDKLPEDKKKHKYNLFTDNLFTNFYFLSQLKTEVSSPQKHFARTKVQTKYCTLMSKKSKAEKQLLFR